MSDDERVIKPEFVIERQGRKAVLYAGLLHMAHEEGLKSIDVILIQCPSDANGRTAICRAEVETTKGRFADVGDADPTNVGTFLIPHVIRMAATRAKARALRDALDIGYVAVEELTDIEALGGQDRGGGGRSPGVTTRAQQRVDEDLGRSNGSTYGGGAAPRPVSRPGPAYDERGPRPPDGLEEGPDDFGTPPPTPRQWHTLARLLRASGQTPISKGLTRQEASDQLSVLLGNRPRPDQEARS